ncbi:MAG: lysophospholipid acyltransferase family protein [Victivallaceae bacterium]|nr:lysophospholipid acyltransferase family protein [Victivallaceae bacterium]
MIETLLIAFARLCCGMLVSYENDDFQHSSVVYFANHTSHIDLLAILSVFPRRKRQQIRPVAALDYWCANPLRHYVACKVLHAILLDRQHAMKTRVSFKEMINSLESGKSLLIFPEGSRNNENEPSAFKGGIFHLATLRPETEFIPVALSGFYHTLPKGEFLPAPNVGAIRFGTALRIKEGEDRGKFLARCRQALIDNQITHQNRTS